MSIRLAVRDVGLNSLIIITVVTLSFKTVKTRDKYDELSLRKVSRTG